MSNILKGRDAPESVFINSRWRPNWPSFPKNISCNLELAHNKLIFHHNFRKCNQIGSGRRRHEATISATSAAAAYAGFLSAFFALDHDDPLNLAGSSRP